MALKIRWSCLGIAAVLLSAGVSASAQAPTGGAIAEPPLALTLHASRVRIHGLPRTITIRLTNISKQDLLIPEPHKDCADGMYGSLFFRINIRTAGPPFLGSGCVADYSFAGSHIRDRIKVWKRLAPGQSLVFEKDVALDTTEILRGPIRDGTYTYSASYDPPYIPAQDKQRLNSVHIGFPRQRLQTTALAFTGKAAR
jgi:hypothetical protein